MIPIFVRPEATRIALVGRAEKAVSRLTWLLDAGAAPDVWSDQPSDALISAAGSRLRHGLPSPSVLQTYHLIWVADLPRGPADDIAEAARTARVLINIEDVRALCDFHSPALVRRGALTLAVGTGGASPAVARAARERLEDAFTPAWGEALDSIAAARQTLRESGASSAALAADARSQLTTRGLI